MRFVRNSNFTQIPPDFLTSAKQKYKIFGITYRSQFKVLEIYLYNKYPDKGSNKEKSKLFLDGEKIYAVLIGKINNELSRLKRCFKIYY